MHQDIAYLLLSPFGLASGIVPAALLLAITGPELEAWRAMPSELTLLSLAPTVC
ncbi:MAG: hypothetical protein H6989_08280 [Pseudomonadales bacterium]|nr:hypothetical protein [Pseudomonadales bacterium]